MFTYAGVVLHGTLDATLHQENSKYALLPPLEGFKINWLLVSDVKPAAHDGLGPGEMVGAGVGAGVGDCVGCAV
jgi:hypothetical protein